MREPKTSESEVDEKPQIAKFEELVPYERAFLDSYIAEHEKENFKVIGAGVVDDAAARPVIAEDHGYALSYVRCEPGKGAALHSHQTAEVFVPMNGRMIVAYGPDGEEEIELDQWDVASIPVGTMRAFRNPNDFPLVILALVSRGSGARDRVTWHDDVIAAAAAAGASIDGQGDLVVPAPSGDA